MRVDSIISINAHQQQKPHTVEYTGASSGKTAAGKTFEEYLKANMQQTSNQVVPRQTENQLAGLLMGYYSSLRLTHKEEPKTKSNAG